MAYVFLGLTASDPILSTILADVEAIVSDITVFANTGVREFDIERHLSIVYETIVDTTFWEDGYIWNGVDIERVTILMNKVWKLGNNF